MNYEYQPNLYVPEHARPRPEVRPLNSHQYEHGATGHGDINITSALPLAVIYHPPRPLIPSFAPGPPDDVRLTYTLLLYFIISIYSRFI